MNNKEIQFNKRRDLSLVMSDSFDFLKQEAKPIAKVIAVYVLPFILLYAGAQIYFQRNVLSNFDLSNPDNIMENIGPFYLNLFIFMLFGLFIQSLLIGTFYSYIEAYIKLGRGNFSLSDISTKFFTNSLLALAANLLFAIIVFFGMIFCLIPGIYFANTLSLVVFIFIFERKGISDAMSRSWKLVNLQWWNTFGINILGLLIVYAIGMVISLPSIILGVGTSMFSVNEVNPLEFPDWYWVLTGLSSVITTALLIIPFTFIVFQYFNLKEIDSPTIPSESEE